MEPEPLFGGIALYRFLVDRLLTHWYFFLLINGTVFSPLQCQSEEDQLDPSLMVSEISKLKPVRHQEDLFSPLF